MIRFDGKRVAVVGLGAIANPPLVEFLADRGAEVTACDRKTAAELGDVYQRLAGLPIRFNLGEGYLSDLYKYDIAFLTPAIRRDLPEVVAAKSAGVAISSEILQFMKLCPAKKVGITGSSGKTTTTTILGRVFREAGAETFVAGNIGVSLIKEAEWISPEATVVLELSSFQLQDFDVSPEIAVVTNVTPNHLDYHPTMAEYTDAKKRIFLSQRKGDTAILNWDDPVTRAMASEAPGRVLFYSRREKLKEGAYVDGGRIIVAIDGKITVICDTAAIKLPGLHNLENALAVSAVAGAAGLPAEILENVFSTFRGVAHRLEFVRTFDGVDYYNDSIATTPDRTSAGVSAFDRPIVLLAGGYDKKLPFDRFAALLPGRTKAVMLIGKTAPLIREAIERVNLTSSTPVAMVDCGSFEEAVLKAREEAAPGDVVLLSPACASMDMFRNFEERGDKFKEMVNSF